MRTLFCLLLIASASTFSNTNAAQPDSNKSSVAIFSLKTALEAKPKALADLIEKDFASVSLTKTDAALAKALLWKHHLSIIQAERSLELKNRILIEGKLEMPFDFKTFGDKPIEGRSLWISLHGGGGAPKQVNDQQ